jgi:hypothetical protein
VFLPAQKGDMMRHEENMVSSIKVMELIKRYEMYLATQLSRILSLSLVWAVRIGDGVDGR